MKPIYIFDLDGTLANMEHRVRFIQRPDCVFCGWSKRCFHDDSLNEQRILGKAMPLGERPAFNPDWRAFFAACVDDTPIPAALTTLRALHKGGAEVWVWTGRSDEVREQTLDWLYVHKVFHPFWNPMRAPEALLMRKAGDHQPDVKLKFGWLANLEPPERGRLTAVFEDRASVVRMWRDAGVPCFQVAPGEF